MDYIVLITDRSLWAQSADDDTWDRFGGCVIDDRPDPDDGVITQAEIDRGAVVFTCNEPPPDDATLRGVGLTVIRSVSFTP